MASSVAILQELKKSSEWKCQTAAQSPTGKADDCGDILSKSLGFSEFLIGNSCCYTWTGNTDFTKAKGANYNFVSNAF